MVGFVEVTLALPIMLFVFGVPLRGSLVLLYLLSGNDPPLVKWVIAPNGSGVIYSTTNIPPSVIGAVGYLAFWYVGNGNAIVLSNFNISAGFKPSRRGN